ncbi:MAG: hypothetical protein EXR06_00780 [Rickettsiales bacterium]|nr:hypothetical protein [Rickettsiales bacterium]
MFRLTNKINKFMNKGILIKAVVILLVAVLVHSVFWFFKTGQLEKHLNNFVAENAATVSAGEIKVVGYPLSQKVIVKDLKFTIPHAAFGKQQVIIKNLQAISGIFSSDFIVELMDKITTQDTENNAGLVEFNQNPQIAFSVVDGIVAKFTYSDSGYRIFDIDKNIIYSAASSSVNIDSTIDANDQVVSKILVIAKDIEGFDVVDIYKNSSEKKVIDGIKTGEILIGGGANAALISSEPFVDPAVNLPAGIVPAPVVAAVAPTPVVASQDPAKAAEVAGAGVAVAGVAAVPVIDGVAPIAHPIDVASVVAKNDVIKSNLLIDIEYVLTPTKNEQQSSVPLDPTQIQEVTTQYSRAVKVNNIEFSNSLYKIILNGQANYFQDDNLPSGFITIKVENIDKLATHIASGLTQIAEQKQAIPAVQSGDLAMQSPQSQGTAYQEFLKKVVVGLSNVAKELSAKNQLSKDNIAIFDMRREKNLEFVINETPLREVLGKF